MARIESRDEAQVREPWGEVQPLFRAQNDYGLYQSPSKGSPERSEEYA